MYMYKGGTIKLHTGRCVTVSVTMNWDHLTYHNTINVSFSGCKMDTVKKNFCKGLKFICKGNPYFFKIIDVILVKLLTSLTSVCMPVVSFTKKKTIYKKLFQ